MPLDDCPHMAAKCPHYKIDCNDNASVACHYIKNTTGVATGVLRMISMLHQDAPDDSINNDALDADYESELRKELADFLEATKLKQQKFKDNNQ